MTEPSANDDGGIPTTAATWFVRLAEADAKESHWEEFTTWLEQDPRHSRAYERVCEADSDLLEVMANRLPEAANDDGGGVAPLLRRRGFLGGAMAAVALVAAVFLWPTAPDPPSFETIRTAAGEVRSISLANGSRIELNGGTHLELASEDASLVRLIEGEAAFYVARGDGAPLTVEVGDLTLVDRGTVFNVVRGGGWIRVGVAEGEIVANPGREAVSLPAGRSLRFAEGSGRFALERTDPTNVTGWRQGRLAYRDAPASMVAADLARNLGVDVAVEDELTSRRFTGVIQLTGEPSTIISTSAGLMEGRAVRDGDGWRLLAD